MKQTNKLSKINSKLINPTTESIIYLGYYYPKTQSQLADFFYRYPKADFNQGLLFHEDYFHYKIPKTPIMVDDYVPKKYFTKISNPKINTKPFTKARRNLMEHKLIKQLGTHNLKRYFCSIPDPYIKFIENEINSRYTSIPEEHKIEELELNYVKFLIDSTYFRKTFFNNLIFAEYDGFSRDIIYHDIKKRKFVVKSAFQYISNMLGHIAIPSYYLREEFENYYVKRNEMKQILDKYTTFDEFLFDFIKQIKDNDVENLHSNEIIRNAFNYLGDYSEIDYYFENVIYNYIFLMIPYTLANKIILLGQGLHTTENAFSGNYTTIYI